MGRKLFWILAAASLFVFWHFGYQASLRYFFNISGTVSLAPGTIPPLPSNTMLFVVAKNHSGVPVALKKAINPRFPYSFEMNSSNLIMPDLLTRKLSLEAHLNTHGSLGRTEKSDLRGEHGDPLAVRSDNADIKLFNHGR